jgi:hypothetical protein
MHADQAAGCVEVKSEGRHAKHTGIRRKLVTRDPGGYVGKHRKD